MYTTTFMMSKSNARALDAPLWLTRMERYELMEMEEMQNGRGKWKGSF